MTICEDCLEKKYCPIIRKLDVSECPDFLCKECFNRKYYLVGTCSTCGNTWDSDEQ